MINNIAFLGFKKGNGNGYIRSFGILLVGLILSFTNNAVLAVTPTDYEICLENAINDTINHINNNTSCLLEPITCTLTSTSQNSISIISNETTSFGTPSGSTFLRTCTQPIFDDTCITLNPTDLRCIPKPPDPDPDPIDPNTGTCAQIDTATGFCNCLEFSSNQETCLVFPPATCPTGTIFNTDHSACITEQTPQDPDPTPCDPNIDTCPTDPTTGDPSPSDPTPSDPNPSDPNPSDPNPSDPNPSDPNPSDPSPSDPIPTGGTGSGSGTENNSASGTGCSEPLVCEGDSIQCAILQNNKDHKCLFTTDNLREDNVLTDGEAELEKHHKDINVADLANFDDSGFLGASSCPSPDQINYGLGSMEVDYTPLCTLAESISFLILGFAYFLGARILLGGI